MKQIPVIAYDVLAVAESFAPRDHPKADTFFQHPYLTSYSRCCINDTRLIFVDL